MEIQEDAEGDLLESVDRGLKRLRDAPPSLLQVEATMPKRVLYRIGPNSPLIDLLIEAADAGKQVAVLVELKARLDERANIKWATRLESAGIHVVYGVENLKTHCKLCLVVRKDPDGVRRYVHIGTGNYNATTALIYTDLGLFTADPEVGDDVQDVFNYLTGYSKRKEYRQLLIAPVSLRPRFMALLERELDHARNGRPAHVIAKTESRWLCGFVAKNL
jgi:polyphosphate kinase